MTSPPTVLIPVEHEGDLYVIEAVDPSFYPLGPHFAMEAFRWEMAMESRDSKTDSDSI